MRFTISDICKILGFSDTLIRNHLCLPEFESKRVIMSRSNKYVYELTEDDLKNLKDIITTRVRWFRSKKEVENVECKR